MAPKFSWYNVTLPCLKTWGVNFHFFLPTFPPTPNPNLFYTPNLKKFQERQIQINVYYVLIMLFLIFLLLNHFPTIRLVSFRQPRYYTSRMRCCTINKEDNTMLINSKRSTSKKTKKTKKKKNSILREEMFAGKIVKFLRKIFLRLSSKKFNFRGWHFLLFLPPRLLCTSPPPEFIWSEVSILIYLLGPPLQLIN